MARSERRQVPRHDLRTPVEIKTAGDAIHAEAMDIGLDGIRVTAPRPIPPGTTVTILIPLKEGAYVRGPVIWTVETGKSGLPAYLMGIGADAMGTGETSAVGHAEKSQVIQSILEKIHEEASA